MFFWLHLRVVPDWWKLIIPITVSMRVLLKVMLMSIHTYEQNYHSSWEGATAHVKENYVMQVSQSCVKWHQMYWTNNSHYSRNLSALVLTATEDDKENFLFLFTSESDGNFGLFCFECMNIENSYSMVASCLVCTIISVNIISYSPY